MNWNAKKKFCLRLCKKRYFPSERLIRSLNSPINFRLVTKAFRIFPYILAQKLDELLSVFRRPFFVFDTRGKHKISLSTLLNSPRKFLIKLFRVFLEKLLSNGSSYQGSPRLLSVCFANLSLLPFARKIRVTSDRYAHCNATRSILAFFFPHVSHSLFMTELNLFFFYQLLVRCKHMLFQNRLTFSRSFEKNLGH